MQSENLKEMIAIDREEMMALLALIDEVVGELRQTDLVPNEHLVVALGAYVQSLYQGVENILKRVALFDGVALAKSDRWHADLLDLFTANNSLARRPLFDEETRKHLDEMRGFRHVFRVHYASRLNWIRLEPLAGRCRETIESFFSALDRSPI